MGKYFLRTFFCALTCSILLTFFPPLLAQDSAKPVTHLISQEDYDRLLGVVFRNQQPTAVQSYYSIVLRFMPSRYTESEVAIYARRDGTIHAILLRVSGSSAWNIANDFIQRVGNVEIHRIALA